MTTYTVQGMRVIRPSKIVAERNPDRFATVKGKFFDEANNPLTLASKEITFEDAANPETVIDITNGKLVLPSGTRGRKASASISQDDINSELEALRSAAAAN